MNPSLLLYDITLWMNGVAIGIFITVEIFWFVKQKSGIRNAPALLVGFIVYNLPFWLLAISMYLQSVPEGWIGVLRLVFLSLAIPTNLWLHYHGDKGGNSIGMFIVFFLLIAIPLIVVIEGFIALY